MEVTETTDTLDEFGNIIRREDTDGTITICHYDSDHIRDGLANNRGYRAGWYLEHPEVEAG